MQERWIIKNIILPIAGSDHWPINIRFEMQATTHAKPFKFEKNWLSHPDIANNIKTWWREASDTEGSLMYHFQQRINKLKGHLKIWNKLVFGSIHQAKKDLERKMETIQQEMILNGRTNNLVEEENTIQKKLEERYTLEEFLWRHKSRIQWLKEGEKNTTFFHRSMIQRR